VSLQPVGGEPEQLSCEGEGASERPPGEGAYLHAIQLALPEHAISAADAEARLRAGFEAAGEDPSTIAGVFEHAGIAQRHLAKPPAFYLEQRGLTARNGAYAEVAPQLAIDAARRALDAAGLTPADVDLVIDTSCTGVLIPALDVYVANALGLRKDVRRVPLTEAGCAAGATALGLARDLLAASARSEAARAHPNGPQALGTTALVICVELPSLTLQLHDTSRANLISSAIFGDGASAAVVTDRPPQGPALELLAHRSVLFPDSQDVMGFDLKTEGFQIVLSPRIPLLVRRNLREEVDAFLDGLEVDGEPVSLERLELFVLHPGGTKVLDNLRDVLGLDEHAVRHSRGVLRDCGNLSSASVFYVAQRTLAEGAFRPGALGLLCAMGPGFTVELLLVRALG